MEIFWGYVLGVLLHVVFKWGTWKSENTASSWGAYWKAKAGENVSSGVAAVVFYGLWSTGLLAVLILAIYSSALSVMGASMDAGTNPELPITFATSIFAGYVMDSIARALTNMIRRKVEK